MRINEVTYEKLKTPLKVDGNLNKINFSAPWSVRANIQNRNIRVLTEVEFSSKIGTIPPESGRMDTLCKGFRGIREHGLPEKMKFEVFKLLEMH